ncbi:MAG TPA: 30S ribosomal protein S9 [Anaerolineae bacterium]|nr:30S ribosomal protein S9 [Anaerolineae bacterium]
MAMEGHYYEGLGRRKEASARVRLYSGEGVLVINDKPADEYFSRPIDLKAMLTPLRVTGFEGKFDVSVKVQGGGVTGQAGAVSLGIARALLVSDPELRKTLRQHGLLTRDARAKERKKPGLKRARKAPQYTKR